MARQTKKVDGIELFKITKPGYQKMGWYFISIGRCFGPFTARTKCIAAAKQYCTPPVDQ